MARNGPHIVDKCTFRPTAGISGTATWQGENLFADGTRYEFRTPNDVITIDSDKKVALAGGATQFAISTKTGYTKQTKTFSGGQTSFAVTRNFVEVVGQAGGTTLATITGGIEGIVLSLKFLDALVTVTDDDTGTADTISLSAGFSPSAGSTLTLLHDGNKWFELSRSTN